MGHLRLESTSTTYGRVLQLHVLPLSLLGRRICTGITVFTTPVCSNLCSSTILYHAPVAVTAECSLVQSSNFLDKNEKATWYPSQVSISGFGVLY